MSININAPVSHSSLEPQPISSAQEENITIPNNETYYDPIEEHHQKFELRCLPLISIFEATLAQYLLEEIFAFGKASKQPAVSNNPDPAVFAIIKDFALALLELRKKNDPSKLQDLFNRVSLHLDGSKPFFSNSSKKLDLAFKTSKTPEVKIRLMAFLQTMLHNLNKSNEIDYCLQIPSVTCSTPALERATATLSYYTSFFKLHMLYNFSIHSVCELRKSDELINLDEICKNKNKITTKQLIISKLKNHLNTTDLEKEFKFYLITTYITLFDSCNDDLHDFLRLLGIYLTESKNKLTLLRKNDLIESSIKITKTELIKNLEKNETELKAIPVFFLEKMNLLTQKAQSLKETSFLLTHYYFFILFGDLKKYEQDWKASFQTGFNGKALLKSHLEIFAEKSKEKETLLKMLPLLSENDQFLKRLRDFHLNLNTSTTDFIALREGLILYPAQLMKEYSKYLSPSNFSMQKMTVPTFEEFETEIKDGKKERKEKIREKIGKAVVDQEPTNLSAPSAPLTLGNNEAVEIAKDASKEELLSIEKIAEAVEISPSLPSFSFDAEIKKIDNTLSHSFDALKHSSLHPGVHEALDNARLHFQNLMQLMHNHTQHLQTPIPKELFFTHVVDVVAEGSLLLEQLLSALLLESKRTVSQKEVKELLSHKIIDLLDTLEGTSTVFPYLNFEDKQALIHRDRGEIYARKIEEFITGNESSLSVCKKLLKESYLWSLHSSHETTAVPLNNQLNYLMETLSLSWKLLHNFKKIKDGNLRSFETGLNALKEAFCRHYPQIVWENVDKKESLRDELSLKLQRIRETLTVFWEKNPPPYFLKKTMKNILNNTLKRLEVKTNTLYSIKPEQFSMHFSSIQMLSHFLAEDFLSLFAMQKGMLFDNGEIDHHLDRLLELAGYKIGDLSKEERDFVIKGKEILALRYAYSNQNRGGDLNRNLRGTRRSSGHSSAIQEDPEFQTALSKESKKNLSETETAQKTLVTTIDALDKLVERLCKNPVM